MTIPNIDKLVTLDEWSAIMKYLESQRNGASALYRDYFFHRSGVKHGTGLKGVTMYEALKVAEMMITSDCIEKCAS